MKDELKAANDVIRYQREFIKELIEQKKSAHSTTIMSGSGEFNLSAGVQSLVQRLQLQISKLQHDRAWGEFQLRSRITNDSATFAESIRRWKKEAKDWQIRFKTAAFDHSVETRKLQERIKALETALQASGEDVPAPPPTTGLGRQVTWAVGDRDNTHFTTSSSASKRTGGHHGHGHHGHGHQRRPRRNSSRANPPLLTRFATLAFSPMTGLTGGADEPSPSPSPSPPKTRERPGREFRGGRQQQRPARATSTPISTTTAGTAAQAPVRSSSRIANLELFVDDVEERDRLLSREERQRQQQQQQPPRQASSGLFTAATAASAALDEFGGDPLSESWKSAVADASTEEMEADQSKQSRFLQDAMKRQNSFRFFV